jgi:predicted kinase
MEVVLMIGLQASGKSTFARSTFGATHQYVSKDLLRNNSHPVRRQRQLIETALQQGLSVVVDNTHATREAREELVALGQRYRADILGYYFAVQVEQCLERNRTREGKARVPDVALFATLKKLARPSYTEGFTTLFYVRNEGDGTFVVSPWEEEDRIDG